MPTKYIQQLPLLLVFFRVIHYTWSTALLSLTELSRCHQEVHMLSRACACLSATYPKHLVPLHAQQYFDGELKPWELQPMVASLPASNTVKSLSAFNDVNFLPALHGLKSLSGLLKMRAWKQQSALFSLVRRVTQTPQARQTGLARKPLVGWKPILMRTVASRTPPKQVRLSLHDMQGVTSW